MVWGVVTMLRFFALLSCAFLCPDAVFAQDALRNLDDFKVSAKKQRHAVASRTLTWLTGSSEQNDYISVGRLANFFGFVKFRVASAHSLSRASAGQETFDLLEGGQQDRVLQLLDEQRRPFGLVATARLDMNRALEGLLLGHSFAREDFLNLGEVYGSAEADLGRLLAVGLGEIAMELDLDRRERMQDMRERYLAGKSGKYRLSESSRKRIRQLGDGESQELWNLSSRLLTWVTGTSEDNDFETVGKPSQHFGFVALRVESGHAVKRGLIAEEVLDLLDDGQRAAIDRVVAEEIDLFERFLTERGKLMRELERALVGDEVRAERVSEMGARVGRLEAAMTWGQAVGMVEVRDSLTAQQAEALLAMRDRYVPREAPLENEHSGEVQSIEAAQLARGRQLFAQCALCHVARDGGRAAGPSLNDLLGREIASDPHFSVYSPAMRSFAEGGRRWTEKELDAFLESPRTLIPGTIMGFDGIASPSDRAALIHFLEGRVASKPQEAPVAREVVRSSSQAASSARPNILVIVADDLGWADVGYHGSEIATPSIDALAREGVELDRMYAYPICSQTRAALLTGRSSEQHGLTGNPDGPGTGLDTGERLIVEDFADAGYATWMIGKWHLGPGQGERPEDRGFDHFYGITHGATHSFDHTRPDTGELDWWRNRELVEEDGHSSDLFAREAVQLIDAHSQGDFGGTRPPFFLLLSFNAVHGPHLAPEDLFEKYGGRKNRKHANYAGMLEGMDRAIARVLSCLDDHGLRRETIVCFLGDNGGQMSRGVANNLPLRGEKGQTWEGGVRVPAAIQWPGRLEGGKSEQFLTVLDLLPTLAEAAGVSMAPLERVGISLWKSLGSGKTLPRPAVAISRAGRVAVFDFPWKLVIETDGESGEPVTGLFHLLDDPEESTDRSSFEPERLEALRALVPEGSKKRGGRGNKQRGKDKKRADRGK